MLRGKIGPAASRFPAWLPSFGIVNLSEDPGIWPPFVALRKAQSRTCSSRICEIGFKLTIPTVKVDMPCPLFRCRRMGMRNLLAAAVATLVLTAPAKSQQTAEKVERRINHDPEAAALITSDILNFWRAFDQLKTN
jgi:hypothetical protein